MNVVMVTVRVDALMSVAVLCVTGLLLLVVTNVLAHWWRERAGRTLSIREVKLMLLDWAVDSVLSMLEVGLLRIVSRRGCCWATEDVDSIDDLVDIADAWLIGLVCPAGQRRRDEALLDRHRAEVGQLAGEVDEGCR